MAENKQPFPGFIGPSYQDRAHVYDAQETINFYLETDPTNMGKNQQPVVFISTPGLRFLQTIGTGPIRATYTVSNQLVTEQYCYVVSGNEIYQLSGGLSTPTLLTGNLTTSTGPISVTDNGQQVVFVDGQNGYFVDIGVTGWIASVPNYSGVGNGTITTPIVNQLTATAESWLVTAISASVFTVVGSKTGALANATAGILYTNAQFSFTISVGSTPYSAGDEYNFTVSSGGSINIISDPFYYPSSFVSFQDSVLIFTQTGTNHFFVTNPDEVTFYEFNQGSKAGNSDLLVAAVSVSRQLYLLGVNTTEIWWNTGSSTVPNVLVSQTFARQDGRFSQIGCAAAASIAIIGEQFCWLGSNAQGNGIVYTLEGSLPKRISTHAVEFSIQNTSGNISESTGFAYQQEGHYFYCLQVPGLDCTWVYDMVTEQWHKRASWVNGVQSQWIANTHCLLNDIHICGDSSNGNLYQLDLDCYTDNGETRYYIRQTPHVAANLNNIFYKLLEIDFQFGVGVPDTSQPVISEYTQYGMLVVGSAGVLSNGSYKPQYYENDAGNLTSYAALTALGSTYIGLGNGIGYYSPQVPPMNVGETYTIQNTTSTTTYYIPMQMAEQIYVTAYNITGSGSYTMTLVVGWYPTAGRVYSVVCTNSGGTSTINVTRLPDLLSNIPFNPNPVVTALPVNVPTIVRTTQGEMQYLPQYLAAFPLIQYPGGTFDTTQVGSGVAFPGVNHKLSQFTVQSTTAIGNTRITGIENFYVVEYVIGEPLSGFIQVGAFVEGSGYPFNPNVRFGGIYSASYSNNGYIDGYGNPPPGDLNTPYGLGDVIGMVIDCGSSQAYFFKNGIQQVNSAPLEIASCWPMAGT